MAVWLVAVLACTPQDPRPDSPGWSDSDRSCAAAWQELTMSLDALHRDAGMPPAVHPGVATLVAVCRSFDLTTEATTCLSPSWYAGHRDACDTLLPAGARDAFHAPFLAEETP